MIKEIQVRDFSKDYTDNNFWYNTPKVVKELFNINFGAGVAFGQKEKPSTSVDIHVKPENNSQIIIFTLKDDAKCWMWLYEYQAIKSFLLPNVTGLDAGYIMGTHSPYVATMGMQSASNMSGYILWLKLYY